MCLLSGLWRAIEFVSQRLLTDARRSFAQGTPVTISVRVGRWRCRNERCDRQIFAERLPGIAAPSARQTDRLAEIVRLFGHSVVGRPSARLMARLGMHMSHTTIVRRLKQHAGTKHKRAAARIAGVDEWAWRKRAKFGTIVVDLERRRVVDLLADHAAAQMAAWFKQHPEVEIINRDRDDLYADAARQGAPQARQVADRVHLLKNLRRPSRGNSAGSRRPSGNLPPRLRMIRTRRNARLRQIGIQRRQSGNG